MGFDAAQEFQATFMAHPADSTLVLVEGSLAGAAFGCARLANLAYKVPVYGKALKRMLTVSEGLL